MKYLIWMMSFCLAACTSAPKNIDPVTQFQVDRYLGTWYEIVRQDHAFEEGLSNVTARYSMRDDGGVDVVNRGYSEEDRDWREAKGIAYFVNSSDVGHLKVSFFGPFYGAYVIFALDKKIINTPWCQGRVENFSGYCLGLQVCQQGSSVVY